MAARSRFFRHPSGDAPYWDGYGLSVRVIHADRLRATLRLAGELDLASAATLSACLDGQLAEGRRHLGVDLTELTFIDATGLSVLVRAHHQLLEHRGALVIVEMSDRCRQLIGLVGLDHTLLIADQPVVRTQPSGIRRFRAAGRTVMPIGISAR
jgi:anti-anti-sigma factor